jgi:hypothetical protein
MADSMSEATRGGPLYDAGLVLAVERRKTGADVHEINNLLEEYKTHAGGFQGYCPECPEKALEIAEIFCAWLSGRAKTIKAAKRLVTDRRGTRRLYGT